MSFRFHARRAADPGRPMRRRVADFRACLARYCRLARQPFPVLAARLNALFDLETASGLPDALALLEAERDLMLARHELYAVWKRRRRQMRPPAVVRPPLYGACLLGDADRLRAPRAYVIWSYRDGGISWRLVKRPPGQRLLLSQAPEFRPARVAGPFTGQELAAYLTLETPWPAVEGVTPEMIELFMRSEKSLWEPT